VSAKERRNAQCGRLGRGIGERRTLCNLFGEPREIRIGDAPLDIGCAQIEVAERAPARDIGERVPIAMAPCAVAQFARHLGHTFVNLAALALDPFAAAELSGPPALDDYRRGRIANPIRQRFPFPYRNPLPRGLGNKS